MEFGSILAETPLFAGLDDSSLERLAGLAERRDVRSGEALYELGDPPTHVYLVVSGRLHVSANGAVLGYVGRLEPVGEMGIVAGEPRSSTVRAVRDSIVLQIPSGDFVEFLHEQPAALMALSRLMIGRLREQGRTRMVAATEVQGTFAVIPASDELPAMALAEELVRRLSGWPAARLVSAAHVDAALGEGAAQTALEDHEDGTRLLGWLNELESRHRYLVFVADGGRDNWALRCLHGADRVLVLGETNERPRPVPVLSELREGKLLAPVELVLLRPEGDPSPHTLAWRAETGARAHYFVHPWSEGDLASLARQVTGRGVGLALGGGARGFAHIGLIRALERLEIPVDVIGGTSMGAFISALLAYGLESVEIAQVVRETFVTSNYLNDYAVPRVSLIRGRRFGARLREIFGEQTIEELRRTYFCVSTNLTTGAAVVHDGGPLAVWVGTSMAIPGVAPPIAYEGELLCDGGVVDNLPTDVMQSLERGSIIASNVSTEGTVGLPGAGLGGPDPEALLRWRGKEPPPRLSEILLRTATLTSTTSMQRAAERADIYVRMPSEDVGLFDWKRLEELIERGYEHALEQLTPLRDSLVG